MSKLNDSASYSIKQLESKNAKNTIIQKLASDFDLTPIIAEAYYSQISHYFNETCEVSCEAVSAEEPASK